MKNELNSFNFPKDVKNILLLEQKNLKQLRDDFNFDQAFGMIWTNTRVIIFVME